MITLRAVPQRMLIRRMRLLLLAILILIAPRPSSAEPSAAHWRAGDLEALRNVAFAAGAEGVSAVKKSMCAGTLRRYGLRLRNEPTRAARQPPVNARPQPPLAS
jgi:hypothetical protein